MNSAVPLRIGNMIILWITEIGMSIQIHLEGASEAEGLTVGEASGNPLSSDVNLLNPLSSVMNFSNHRFSNFKTAGAKYIESMLFPKRRTLYIHLY
ncbi:hypothetical protein D8Z77_15470 [Brevibacillus laterosporus]|nr:hypothetical protein D8Z77_15470 [Brevibacillus laterosporus]